MADALSRYRQAEPRKDALKRYRQEPSGDTLGAPAKHIYTNGDSFDEWGYDPDK